ncbi:MAG TPA: outer membrane beta-barrel protein [Caulobacteraceae bacterium]|jgi:outer membrane immunogenic protein
MNKKILMLAVASGFALAGAAANAQPAPGVADWSGFYLGANGGWNWNDTHNRSSVTVNQLTGVDAGAGPVSVPATTFPAGRFGRDQDGFMGGGQVGYNVQAGGFVFGAEGDFDGLTGRRSQTSFYSLPATGLTTGSLVSVRQDTNPDWVATLRGRAGFALDRTLLYGTGGVAWADMRNRASFTYAPSVTGAVTTANPGTTFGPYSNGGGNDGVRTGWTAGGGVEFLAAPNITVGAEYRHTEIGGGNGFVGSSAPNGVSERGSAGFHDDAVLGRVNVKFSEFSHMF